MYHAHMTPLRVLLNYVISRVSWISLLHFRVFYHAYTKMQYKQTIKRKFCSASTNSHVPHFSKARSVMLKFSTVFANHTRIPLHRLKLNSDPPFSSYTFNYLITKQSRNSLYYQLQYWETYRDYNICMYEDIWNQ